MSDKAPANKPTLRESIGDGAPDFTETLTFVLEVVPVSPLLASPQGVPPIESNAPMPPAMAEPAIPAAPLGPMQRPGSPLLPLVLGAGGPIVLEGHNITHFSLDMATHGFTGEITFRISESKWLGDPKERDRLLRAFQGENILMLKLTIKPVFKDRKFTPYLTPEMVPKPTTLVPRTPFVTNTGKVVPHSVPIMLPQLKLVGMPVNFEEGLLPQAIYQPIEMQLTAVLTERAMSEHTSRTAPDVIVSYREYRARFADPAQAIWRQHFPLALYTRKSVKQVVEQHRPGLFSILFKGSELSKTEDQIFVGCDIRKPPSERASFYDWLMWRVEKARATWEYDYNNNVYRVMRRPERAQPFEMYAEDIGKVITYYPEESRFQEWLLNDYVPAARQAQVPNLQGLVGVWQDHLFHSEVMLEFEAEWMQRISRWKMPDPEFVLHFKRFPMKPFTPGVGLKFDLDPMAFPNEHMVIPKEAQRGRQPSRVYRVRLRGESLEDDISPVYQGRTDGKFKLQLAVWLQSPRDRLGRLPQYIQPRYPVDIEGVIACDNQGAMIYQYYTELLTNVKYYQVRLPLFYNQKVRVPYIPNKDTGHFYFPPYKNERVLVSLFSDRSEIKSFLDWRMTAETPLPTQGNQIVMGRELANGAAMRLWYAGEIPELWLQRYKDESFQYVRLYQSGVEMKSVQGPPKLGRVIAAASKGAGAAQAAGSGLGGVTTIGIRKPVGGGGGTLGAQLLEPVRAAAKSEPQARWQGSLPVGPRPRASLHDEPGAEPGAQAARRREELAEVGGGRFAQHQVRQAARAGAAVARAGSAAPKVSPPLRPPRGGGGDVAVAERPAVRAASARATVGRATDRTAASASAAEPLGGATKERSPIRCRATKADSEGKAGGAATEGRTSTGRATKPGRATRPGRAEPAPRTKGRAPRGAEPGSGGAPPTRGSQGGGGGDGPPPGGPSKGPGDGGAAGEPMDEAAPVSPAPLESSLALDSASGVALGLTDTLGGGAHGLSMKAAGLKMQSRVGAAESVLSQEGDVVTLRARELNIDVDTIRVTAKTSASYQSLGQLTLSSLADLTLQTAAAMTQTAMGGLTISTLKLLVSALEAIRLLAVGGGVGVVGGGPGVEIFGSNFSATGLRSTLSGVTTDVLGKLVNIAQPGAVAGGADGLFTGLGAGDLAALAAVLQQLAPRPDAPTKHAYEPVPGSATAKPAGPDSAERNQAPRDQKPRDQRPKDKQDLGNELAAQDAEPEDRDEPQEGAARDGEPAAPRRAEARQPAAPGAGGGSAGAPPAEGAEAPGAERRGAQATSQPSIGPPPQRKRRRRGRHLLHARLQRGRLAAEPGSAPAAPADPAAPEEAGPEGTKPAPTVGAAKAAAAADAKAGPALTEKGGFSGEATTAPRDADSPVELMEKLTRLRADLTLDLTTHQSTVDQVYDAIPPHILTPVEEMDALLTAFEDQHARDGRAAGLRAAVDGFRAAQGEAEPRPGAAGAAPETPPPMPVPGLPPTVFASAEALAALFLKPVVEPVVELPGPAPGAAAPPSTPADAGSADEAAASRGEDGAQPAAQASAAQAKAAAPTAPGSDVGALAQGLQQAAGPPPKAEAASKVDAAERAAAALQAAQEPAKELENKAAGLVRSAATAADAAADAAGQGAADAAKKQLGGALRLPSLPRELADLKPDGMAAPLGALKAELGDKSLATMGAAGKEAAQELTRSVEKTAAAAAAAGKGLGEAMKRAEAARELTPDDLKARAQAAARRALLGDRGEAGPGAPLAKEGVQPPDVASSAAAAGISALAGADAARNLPASGVPPTGARGPAGPMPGRPATAAPPAAATGPGGADKAPLTSPSPAGKAVGPGAAPLPLAAGKGAAGPGAPSLRSALDAAAGKAKELEAAAAPGSLRAADLRPPVLPPAVVLPLGVLGTARGPDRAGPGTPPAPGPGGAKAAEAGARPPGAVLPPPATASPTPPPAEPGTRLLGLAPLPGVMPVPVSSRALVVHRVQQAVFDSITELVEPRRGTGPKEQP
ncbi:MAG: hypothetical protein U1A78_39645 [Polyangia bacterium]